MDAEVEAAAWADTFRTALGLIRAERDRDKAAWWALYEQVTVDRLPMLVKILSMLGAVHRSDRWFTRRLASIGEAEANGELAGRVREWMDEQGL